MSENGAKKANYDVGYKKPPVHTRWKKGESGGGGGHRKKKQVKLSDFEAAFEEALGTLISVNENGTVRQIKKLNALATQTVNKALKGNHQATNLVLSIFAKRAAAGSDDEPVGPSSDQFKDELEAVFREIAEKASAAKPRAENPETKNFDGPEGKGNSSSGSRPPDDE